MRQRVISSIVGTVLLISVLILYHTPVLTMALALLSGIAVYELLHATRYLESSVGTLLCSLFAAAIIITVSDSEIETEFLYGAALIALIGCALKFHRSFSFQQLSICFFTLLFVPASFSVILRLDRIIDVILICAAAWITDMGAYFVGRAFGKRKLAPEISPNKTVAGAIGGLVCAGLMFPAICYFYALKTGNGFSVFHAIVIGIICSFAGMMGDLFASVIKRETGIKDFGKIMPGHGGVLDRFDSFLFVAPTFYVLIQLLPIFKS